MGSENPRKIAAAIVVLVLALGLLGGAVGVLVIGGRGFNSPRIGGST